MAAPPSLTGAVQVKVTRDAPTLAMVIPVGAPGTVDGVAALDGAEALPGPMLLVAVTVKV